MLAWARGHQPGGTMGIEVKVAGRGRVDGEVVVHDPAVVAGCDLCGRPVDVVVSMGPSWACKECIRVRLDATSIAAWQLRDPAQGLPWGKISG